MARAEGQRAKAAQLGAFATLVLVGCPSFPDVVPCGQLPDPTACPVGRGGTCEDRSCSALYDCVDGRWRLAEECDNPAGSGGAGGAGGAGAGGGSCNPATIDHAGETTGCQPDLQAPDCPAAVAESCSPCASSCLDFFLCTANGWRVVAHCNEDGDVELDP